MKNKRKVNKKAVAAIMAFMMTLGSAAAPLSDSGFAVVPMNVTVADAAAITSYDLNSTTTYKALTKAKVQAMYDDAMRPVGSYTWDSIDSWFVKGKRSSSGSSWYEGVLSQDTVKTFENTVNLYRRLCGLYDISVETGSLYQKGALVRSTDSTFAHNLSSGYTRPKGMSTALWNEGVKCPNMILSMGRAPSRLAYGWISEAGNIAGNTNTGHRMVLLSSALSKLKFGYAESTGLADMVRGTARVKEAAATYPSAGYMPTELVDSQAAAPWMVMLNGSKLRVSDINKVRVTVTSGGKTWTRTKANGGLRQGPELSMYGSQFIEFNKPDIASGKNYTGSYTVNVTGLTDAAGKSASLRYTINFFNAETPYEERIDLSSGKADLKLSRYEFYYDGKEKKPEATVTYNGKTLKRGVDYNLIYMNNTKEGIAWVSASGIGKYKNTVSKTFTILKDNRKDLSKYTASLSASSFWYTGKVCKPTVTVRNGSTVLKQGTDYTVSYTNCTNVGTATVTITGKGDYKGKITKNYKIVKDSRTDLSKCRVSLAKSVVDYDGKAQTPAVTVKYGGKTLKAGTDYTVSYTNNKAVGTAKVTVTGKGSYKGSVSKTFRIAVHVYAATVNTEHTIDRYVEFTGKPIKYHMSLTVNGKKLREGVDYEYTKWENNINIGTAKAYVRFIGKYTGAIIRNIHITDKTVVRAEDCTTTINKSYAFNGKPVAPKLPLIFNGKALTLGKDYTVSYTDNDKPGTATAHFKLTGSYIGWLKISYNIV